MLIKNANIITMKDDCILYGYDLYLEGSVIKEIAPCLESDCTEAVDCTGKYVMPGLFDMHVHLDSPSMLSQLFANGATSVRNMWGKPETLIYKCWIESGEITGPTIYSTGPITDGAAALEDCLLVDSPEQARAAVEYASKQGFDFVKTYPDLSREAYFALMEAAAEAGMKVVGHGNHHITTQELISTGYYSLEHSSCLPADDHEILEIAGSGMWFVPTHTALECVIGFTRGNMKPEDVPNAEYVDRKIARIWEQNITRFRNTPRFFKFSMEDFGRKARLFARYSDKLLLGTDTPMPGVVAGFSLHDELKNMVSIVGLSPYKALLTGTVNAASHLGISHRVGTVERGKTADLLILNDNPLTDISNSSKIFSVIKSGKLFGREALNEMLEQSRLPNRH